MVFKSKAENTKIHWLERWLVPFILVTVGLLQIYLAHTVDLSPWKGGGFGMFAAIDSPSMRVLIVEGLSQDNRLLKLDILRDLDYVTRNNIISLPRKVNLNQLGNKLLSQEFVPVGFRSNTTRNLLKALESDSSVADSIPSPQGKSTTNDELPLYRLRQSADPVSQQNSIATLKAVRLQWWRIRFNHSEVSIRAEPLDQVVEVGEWD